MKYKDYFVDFYKKSISLKNEKSDWMLNLEKGLFLCILEQYFYNKTIPLEKELSAKKVFELLNIDTKLENIDIKLFNNYKFSKTKLDISMFSTNSNDFNMTKICSCPIAFFDYSEDDFFETLNKLANYLDINIYSVEESILRDKFEGVIDEYILNNKTDSLLFGYIDYEEFISDKTIIDSEIKKIILLSEIKNISIYEYLKNHYLNADLKASLYTYTTSKKFGIFIKNLLLNYKKADLVPDVALLDVKTKNDIDVKLKTTIAKRRFIEHFINNSWEYKAIYDRLLEFNKKSLSFKDSLSIVLSHNSENIMIKINNNIVFLNYGSNFKIEVSIYNDYIDLGTYMFSINTPVINCTENNSTYSHRIKICEIDKVEVFSRGKQVFPNSSL